MSIVTIWSVFPNPVTYDKMLVTLLIKDKKLLHFKVSKLDQILCVDKIGFLGPGHIAIHTYL